GILMSLMESQYFAATAVHAGGLQPNDREQLLTARRKIPIAIFTGTRDTVVPLTITREARDTLTSRGFPVGSVEMAGHTHNYGERADSVNRQAWDFLKDHALDGEPQYQMYNYARSR